MAKVPITVMGYICERCDHEWIPRDFESEPRVCPKCKSPYWNKPRKAMTTYEDFRSQIEAVLKDGPTTWTDIRTKAKLPQLYPNNQWVRRLEKDISLERNKDAHGIIHWRLANATAKPIAASQRSGKAASRK